MIVIIIVHNLITSFSRCKSLATGVLMHTRMHFHQHLIQHLLHLSLLMQFCFILSLKTQTKDNDASSMTDTTIMMIVIRWILICSSFKIIKIVMMVTMLFVPRWSWWWRWSWWLFQDNHDDGDDAQIENFMHGCLFSTSPASAFVRAALLKSKAGNEVWEMKTRSSVKHKNKLYTRRKSEQNIFGIVDPGL